MKYDAMSTLIVINSPTLNGGFLESPFVATMIFYADEN